MPDVVPASIATTVNLGLGGSYEGSLETAGDRDWVRVQLVAGQTYSFSLHGNGLRDVADTFLNLRDANGALVASNDDGGPGNYSQLRFTATTTGTFYLDAGAYGSGFGDYLLSFNAVVPVTGVAGGLPFFNYSQIANQLTNGYWRDNAAGPRHFVAGNDGAITVNLNGLTADGRTLARVALSTWTDITGVAFTEVGGAAEITFDDNQSGAFETDSVSGTTTTSASVNVSTQWLASYGTGLNSYSFQTYIHEIGHALGLGHAGLYNGSAGYPGNAYYANDSWQATVMSYFDQDDNTQVNGSYAFVLTPQIADIIAIQALYGVSTTTRLGDTVYGFNANSGNAIYNAASFTTPVSFTIYDSGGIDTLDYTGYAVNQVLDLTPAGLSSVGGGVRNIAIAHSTVIENAYGGAGSDVLIGNGSSNVLFGAGGADALLGAGGNDILVGGGGADTLNGGGGADYAFYGNSAGVAVNLSSGGAAGGEATGDLLIDMEHVIGSAFADTLTGNALGNELIGGGGGDVLEGLGGGDVLVGGDGNDTVVYLSSGGGVSINLTNFAGGEADAAGDVIVSVENVTGSGFSDLLRGDALANLLFGASGDDVLIGEGGGDVLVGGGGSDLLVGGSGDDFLFFRNEAGADLVVDFDLNGDDAIIFSGFGPDFDIGDLLFTAVDATTSLITSASWAGSLTLQGTALAHLGTDDFLFV